MKVYIRSRGGQVLRIPAGNGFAGNGGKGRPPKYPFAQCPMDASVVLEYQDDATGLACDRFVRCKDQFCKRHPEYRFRLTRPSDGVIEAQRIPAKEAPRQPGEG